MPDEYKQILEMVADKKINALEAEKLLDAIDEKSGTEAGEEKPELKKDPKYLVIVVRKNNQRFGKSKDVSVRVPFRVLRAGVKLASFLPGNAKNQINEAFSKQDMGFDIDSMGPENIRKIMELMEEISVDVDNGSTTVKFHCE